ncbi:ABC transporter ATP-binding protein [Xylophilus sp.]|uniref:ABC transporter ATP-binding protein n=1 Tax=Xylophilus sp. TaxID=2653893 RepID=UPI0013B7FEE9|nr:ABC transporter ATP-binding protein [Xylophilus sp.]KAF1044486.1 MAG: Spermidine/putrescine import ATP-binding protein PotA [Xylophilus sp.]
MSAADVSLRGLSKRFKDATVVHDFSLDIANGELVALLGPSGCGKTTVLRMLAGFESPDQGQVLIGGRDVTHVEPQRRNTAMVFQRYALFPHLTVQQNVAFGLEMRDVPRAAREARIGEVLKLVRLQGYSARLPHQLSGGQQQRVAIARALAIEPDVLLLDEPLSNLDAKLRAEVREEIRALQRSLGLTTLLVTHDQEEAMTMADRVVVIRQGRIEQVGSPGEVYGAPANRYVAGFVGRMNFFEGAPGNGRFLSQGGIALQVPAQAVDASIIGVRPERIRLSVPGDSTFRPEDAGANRVPVRVRSLVFLGAAVEVHVRTGAGEAFVVHQPNAGATGVLPYEIDQPLVAHFLREDCIPLS